MKYALLIGIGYINTQHALEGPLRDVYKIKETLVDYECTIITDHTETIPTKKVIVEAFLSLLQKKGPLFFYYSGHGQEGVNQKTWILFLTYKSKRVHIT